MAGKILRLLRAARDWASDLFQVLGPCRYSILIVLIGGGAFLLVPQGQDVLQRLVEWGEEPWWKRPLSATLEIAGRWSLFLFSVVVWAASSWYWARVLLYLRNPGSPPDTPRQAWLRRWVPRLLGALALVIMGAALWRAAAGYSQFSTEKPILRLQILSVVCFALAVLFLWLLAKRRDFLRARRTETLTVEAQVESLADLPAGTRRAVAISLTVAVVLGLVFTFWPIWAGRTLGTVPILMLSAATWVLFGTGILYLSRRVRFPLLVLLLAAAVAFSFWNDNHRVRIAETGDTRPVDGTIQESFRTWYQGIKGGPVFLVAAEGGGIRAAYWTAIALAEMQDRNPAFARHVFAISGVSGGSLGAAVFDALLVEQRAREGRLPCGRLRGCAGKVLGHDFLAPTLAKAIAPDVGQRFLFFPVPLFDRARALEDSWAAGWEDAFEDGDEGNRFDRPFLSLWEKDALAIPALVLNGTYVEDGKRIVTTNLRWTTDELHDTYDLLQSLGSDVPLKTAAHNGARFTYISPAGSLVKGRKLVGHVVDAGYFEVSGTVTALELRRVIAESFPQVEDRIHILYLRNAPSIDPGRRRTPGEEPTKRANRGLNELLSPPIALLQTRNARGTLAVTTLRRTVGPERFHELLLCKKLEGEDAPVPLPLGWQLSESARRAMESQLPKGGPEAAPLPGGCPVFNQGNLKRIDRLLSRPAAPVVIGSRSPAARGETGL